MCVCAKLTDGEHVFAWRRFPSAREACEANKIADQATGGELYWDVDDSQIDNPLAPFSDDEIRAEMVRRGLTM